MRAHIAPEVKDHIKATNSIPAVIPGGLTKLLQPLDIAVNRSFKNELRKLWEDWMSTGTHSFTNTGWMRRATYAEVVGWVAQWQRIPVSCIQSGFRKAGLFKYLEPIREDAAEMEIDSSDEEAETVEHPFDPSLFNSDTEDEDFQGFDEADVDAVRERD